MKILSLSLSVFICLNFYPLSAQTSAPLPDGLQADIAWRAWQHGNVTSAEKLFRAETNANPESFQALAGLFELLMYRQKTDEAMALLPRIARAGESAYPFLFSVWNEISLYNQKFEPNNETVEILESLTETASADKRGVLSALALERLGLFYLQNGDTVTATAKFDKLGAIDRWAVIGPFDNISESGFEKVYPPEGKFNPAAQCIGKGNIPVKWFEIPTVRRDKWIDFEYYYAVGADIYYANCFVYSEIRRQVDFRLGVSGSVKAFLNDALIVQDEDEKNNGYDTYIQTVTLNAGWNRILVKTGNGEIERNNFALRLTDSSGISAKGLKYSASPQVYIPAASAGNNALIPNFAEQNYREQLSKTPDSPLAILSLAGCYLLNDKHIEAEAVLLDGLKMRPNAPFYMAKLLEAYSRSGKNDELQALRDKLIKTDSLYANGIVYDFNEKIQNEDYDAAESALHRYEEIYADSPTAIALRIQLYGKKSQNEQFISAIESAYNRFPNIWEFATAYSSTVMGRSQDKDSVIGIMLRALRHNYTVAHLWDIASLYLSFSNVTEWEKFTRKAVALQPVACGYYQAIAEQYLTMQKPDDALPFINRALEISPQSGVFHRSLARIYRAKNDSANAVKEFKATIKYSPIDFDTRAELRAYQGRPSLFSHFAAVKTDSIIRNAPTAETYPDKDYAILFEEEKRIVYENGAFEYTVEMIVRLFTAEAVDFWKEYSISVTNENDGYSIEKAVSIKSDGSEINADISGYDVVFKSLETGDIAHVRWRVRSFNGGVFPNKFWDSYILNGNVPIRYIRFALLVADTVKFDCRTRNSSLEPDIRRVEDGAIYEWTLRNEQPVEDEIGMPSWYEIGKNLEFSSIRSWGEVVRWYLDLTRSQIKPSREVREQARKIRDSIGTASSDLEVIRAVYEYITRNIRYSSVSFRQSAFIPQKARVVLTTKIGDCKDLATLFIALTAEFGIKSHYVLVNSFDPGYARQNPLPSPWAFDHCIAAAEVGGKTFYIDLTAPDFAVGAAPESIIGTFALPIKEETIAPITLSQALFKSNNLKRVTNARFLENNKTQFEISSTRSGWLAAGMRSNYREKSQKDREKMLGESLSQEFQNVEIQNFTFDNFEDIQQDLKYAARYTVSDLASEAGSFYVLKMPWAETWTPSPAFTLEKRTFPLDYPLDADTVKETLTIYLPEGTILMETPKSVKKSSPAAEYSVNYSYSDGILRAERTVVKKNGFIQPAEYDLFKSMYNAAVKEDARQLLLKSAGGRN
ncbi:MAG: hypothetical protein LC116_08990 [Bacteroidetes bacterium]|nr:hypothetical protein [Bacteroidota bacterium]